MSEEVMKLKIELEPEMSETQQQKVLNQIDQIGDKYSKVVGDMLMKENPAEQIFETRQAALMSLYGADSDPFDIKGNTEVSAAVRNLGKVFAGASTEMASGIKAAFEEPVDILKRQMSVITNTYNKTTQWTNSKINQVVAANAYATDYAKRINQMAGFMFQQNGSRKTIGSADAAFFKNFAEIRAAYLTGIEELQHKGTLPKTADTISLAMADPERSRIFRTILDKKLGQLSDADAKAYTGFLTAAALPFYYTSGSTARRAPYIKSLDGVTPWGHLPGKYQDIFLQAANHGPNRNIPKVSRTQTNATMNNFVADDTYARIQKIVDDDRTGVLHELAIDAGLITKEGHKLTWRTRGSDPQIRHFAASLPVELEKIKRGNPQYREDSLETDRWNRRSVVVDSAISELSRLGIVPELAEDPKRASSAPFEGGKQTTMKAFGFPKQYIIPKTSFDKEGNLVYRDPTPEEIRVPRGQKAGIETKNQKFVSTNDSAMMRMLRQTAIGMGYEVDDELGYYRDKATGKQYPLMTKVPLTELWESAREPNGWFSEKGYDAINDKTKAEMSRIASRVQLGGKGTKYGDKDYGFGFLNEDDMFFVPTELREAYEKAAKSAGVLSAFEAGNARGLMGLSSREALVKQINNVKSFNTPSHGKEEYYDLRKGPDDQAGINPQYINWTALARIYEMKTGKPMGKESILDSLAFIKPGGLFDEGFQGRGAGPVMKFAAVLGDIPKTLKESGIIDTATGFGNAKEFLAPSAALNPKNEQEMLDLFRYYYGGKQMHTPKGLVDTQPMTDTERDAFEKKWLFNAANEDINMLFADTSIKDALGSRYLPVDLYRTRTINDLLAQSGFASNAGNEEARRKAAEVEADKLVKLKEQENMIEDGLVRLNADEFKRNLDASIAFHGGIAAVRESGAFEVNKNYMPVSMAQSLNLPYSAYAQSIENYKKMYANWKDPSWVQEHGFASMPEYQRAMENDPSFMETNEGARAYIQSQVKQIREHQEKGELALDHPGYSALAGMTTGMALDFLSELTGNKVNKDSDFAPLFKSALLEMYDYDALSDEEKAKVSETEYRDLYKAISDNNYFIAPGLKKNDSSGYYRAVAERYPAAYGTAVPGRNLYYNSDGSVNKKIQKALEKSGASNDVFYVPPEAMYKMNTGDFDGDTVWAYVSEADEWLKGVENIDTRLAGAKETLAKQKAAQEANMSDEEKEAIKLTFGEEVLRASYLNTYAKGAMGLGSAVIRNALQMPEGPDRDKAFLEGMHYYDLATSEIKKKGLTDVKLGRAGWNALLVGQNFDRLMKNVYNFSNADEESRADMTFPSIFKSNIGSINDMASLGTISMNQATAKAAGGNFALRKKMSDYIAANYNMGTDLGRAADWYSKIRVGDLTGEHFATAEDIDEGYKWLAKIKAEQQKQGSAGRLVYDQHIRALTTALEFMESDMSTSQKNIDAALKSDPTALGPRYEAISMINSNKGYSEISDEINAVIEGEKQQEIESRKTVEELQKDERFKAIQESFAYNPNDPSSFPRRYSVTATEPWFDRTRLPGKGNPVLRVKEINLNPNAVGKKEDTKDLLINGSNFGDFQRKIETQADEIMGGSTSLDIILGNYMHKAFENFWEDQIGYISEREKLNEKYKEYGVPERKGYTKTEREALGEKIEKEFRDLISGEKSFSEGKTFEKEISDLGYELYKNENDDYYQIRTKLGTELTPERQEIIGRVNEKLQSMQGWKLGKSGERVRGSLSNLVNYLYGRQENIQVVGKEGQIFDEKGNVLWDENKKGEPTTYDLDDGTQVSTHAKPDAVVKIGGKYYIIDYKSSQQGAHDSILQSTLYQKQYERRAKAALEARRDAEKEGRAIGFDPFEQFGELDDEGKFVSHFGGVLGFNGNYNKLIEYTNGHKKWGDKDFIDVLEEEYIAAIERKKKDLEEGHYAQGQLELIRRKDRDLARYAIEKGMLPSQITQATSQVDEAVARYNESHPDGISNLSSAETDFYIARYAQDKERLDELEKTLGSERSRLTRRNNPYGFGYDRFAGYQKQIDSLLGSDSLDRMLEVYNNTPEIRTDLEKQMTRKASLLSDLTELRSSYAVEDVEDARRQIMSSLYGVNFDKGGQGLVNIWQQLNKARTTKEGLLADPSLYDKETGFKTEDDTKIHPERYVDQVARDTETTRAGLAGLAEQKYNEATKQYDSLLQLVNSKGFDQIIEQDKEEGQAELQKILGKPLELKSIDEFFSQKVNALIGYVQQKEANIEKLSKMATQSGVSAVARAGALRAKANEEEQRDKALEYLDNPYEFAKIIDAKTGRNGSSDTLSSRINKTYEDQIKAAQIKLGLAKEDVDILRQLGMSEEDLISHGLIEMPNQTAPTLSSHKLAFSPYDNEIVDIRKKAQISRLTDDEEEELLSLINRRKQYFASAGIAAPALPLETDQYIPNNNVSIDRDIEPLNQAEIDRQHQKRIKENTAAAQKEVNETKKYWDLWKTQNEAYAKDAEKAQELSLRSMIGEGNSSELRRLTKLQQARAIREKIVEEKNDKGEYKLSETERQRIRNLLSDPALEGYINEEIANEENLRLARSNVSYNRFMRQGRQLHRNRYGGSRGIASRAYAIHENALSQYERRYLTAEEMIMSKQTEMKGMEKGTPEYANAAKELENLQKASADARAEMESLNKQGVSVGDVFGAFGQTLGMVAQRLGRQFFQKALQETKRFVKEFDASMNEIQAITMKSNEEMAPLRSQTINRAIGLRTSVSNVATTEAALYRQGLNDQEVAQRTESIIKFATVTKLNVADATKIITTALQNDLVPSAEAAMDALVALGDSAATTAAEIGKGMQKAAASAKVAGVSYQELTALLTIGTSDTQLSGTQVGTALQTVFSRMRRLSLTGYTADQNGEKTTSGDAEAALKAVGVELWDDKTIGKMRSGYEVLLDLSKAWQNLSDAQKNIVMNAMAGTKQTNIFSTLMEGMSENNGATLEKYLGLAEDSAGVTQTKYDIAMQSLAASMNTLKSSWDAVVESFINGGTVTGVLDTVSGFLQGFADLANGGVLGQAGAGLSILAGGLTAVFTAIKLAKLGTLPGWIMTLIELAAGLVVGGGLAGTFNGIGNLLSPKAESEKLAEASAEDIKVKNGMREFREKRISTGQNAIEEVKKLGEAYDKLNSKENEDALVLGLDKLANAFPSVSATVREAIKDLSGWKDAVKEAENVGNQYVENNKKNSIASSIQHLRTYAQDEYETEISKLVSPDDKAAGQAGFINYLRNYSDSDGYNPFAIYFKNGEIDRDALLKATDVEQAQMLSFAFRGNSAFRKIATSYLSQVSPELLGKLNNGEKISGNTLYQKQLASVMPELLDEMNDYSLGDDMVRAWQYQIAKGEASGNLKNGIINDNGTINYDYFNRMNAENQAYEFYNAYRGSPALQNWVRRYDARQAETVGEGYIPIAGMLSSREQYASSDKNEIAKVAQAALSETTRSSYSASLRQASLAFAKGMADQIPLDMLATEEYDADFIKRILINGLTEEIENNGSTYLDSNGKLQADAVTSYFDNFLSNSLINPAYLNNYVEEHAEDTDFAYRIQDGNETLARFNSYEKALEYVRSNGLSFDSIIDQNGNRAYQNAEKSIAALVQTTNANKTAQNLSKAISLIGESTSIEDLQKAYDKLGLGQELASVLGSNKELLGSYIMTANGQMSYEDFQKAAKELGTGRTNRSDLIQNIYDSIRSGALSVEQLRTDSSFEGLYTTFKNLVGDAADAVLNNIEDGVYDANVSKAFNKSIVSQRIKEAMQFEDGYQEAQEAVLTAMYGTEQERSQAAGTQRTEMQQYYDYVAAVERYSKGEAREEDFALIAGRDSNFSETMLRNSDLSAQVSANAALETQRRIDAQNKAIEAQMIAAGLTMADYNKLDSYASDDQVAEYIKLTTGLSENNPGFIENFNGYKGNLTLRRYANAVAPGFSQGLSSLLNNPYFEYDQNGRVTGIRSGSEEELTPEALMESYARQMNENSLTDIYNEYAEGRENELSPKEIKRVLDSDEFLRNMLNYEVDPSVIQAYARRRALGNEGTFSQNYGFLMNELFGENWQTPSNWTIDHARNVISEVPSIRPLVNSMLSSMGNQGDAIRKYLAGEELPENFTETFTEWLSSEAFEGLRKQAELARTRGIIEGGTAQEQRSFLSDIYSQNRSLQLAQYGLSLGNTAEGRGYISSVLGYTDEELQDILSQDGGSDRIKNEIDIEIKELQDSFTTVVKSMFPDLNLDFTNVEQASADLDAALENTNSTIASIMRTWFNYVTNAGATPYESFGSVVKSELKGTKETKAAMMEIGNLLSSRNRDYAGILQNSNVQWGSIDQGLLYMLNSRATGQTTFTDEMIDEAYANALYGRSSSPENQQRILSSLFGGDLSPENMISTYQKWMENQDQYAGQLSAFKSLDGIEEVTEAITSQENAVGKTTEALENYNKETGAKQIEYLKKYGKASKNVSDYIRQLGAGAKSSQAAVGSLVTNMNSLAYQNSLLQGISGKAGSALSGKQLEALSGATNIPKEQLKKYGSDMISAVLEGAQDSIDEQWAEEIASPLVEQVNTALSNGDHAIEIAEAIRVNTDVQTGQVDVSALANAVKAIDSNLYAVLQEYANKGATLTAELTGDGTTAGYIWKLLGASAGKTGVKTGGGGGGGKSAIDKMLEEQKFKLSDIQHRIKMTQIDETHYENLNDRDNYLASINHEVDLQYELSSVYASNIAEMQAQLATVKEGSEDWKKLTQAIWEAQEAMNDIKNTMTELNGKRVNFVQKQQDIADKPGSHTQTMLGSLASRAQTEDRFADYIRLSSREVTEINAQRDLNNVQRAEWEAELRDLTEGSAEWIEVRDKIWEIEAENAELENQAIQKQLEIQEARLSQIAKTLEYDTRDENHDNTIAQTYQSYYQNGGYREQYEDTIRMQRGNNASLLDRTRTAYQEAVAQMNAIGKGNVGWDEARQAVFQYQETIAQLTTTQEELNRALAESNLESISEDYTDATREASHVMEMLRTQADEYLENNNFAGYEEAMSRYSENAERVLESEREALARLNAEYVEGMENGTLDRTMQRNYLDAINEREKNILTLSNDIEKATKDVDKTQINRILELQDSAADEADHNLKLLQYQTSVYQNRGQLTNYGEALSEENEIRLENTARLQAEIAELEEKRLEIREKYGAGTDEEERIVQAIKKREEALKAENTQIDKNNKLLEENEQKIRKVRQALENAVDKEIEDEKRRQREMLAANVSMQDNVLNVIKKRYQDEWNLKKKDLEKEKDNLNEYKKLINERFNYRKKAAQEADQAEELADYRRQLALIEADPTRTKDMKELRRKIDELEQNQSWNIAEDEISAENQRIDDQIKTTDDYIAYNEEKLNELLSDANNFSVELSNVLSGSFEESYQKILDFMAKENEAFMKTLPDAQAQMIQSWEDTWKKANDIMDSNYTQITAVLTDKDTFIDFMKNTDRIYRNYIENNDENSAKIMERDWSDLYDNYIESIINTFSFERHAHELEEAADDLSGLDNGLFDYDPKEIIGNGIGIEGLSDTSTQDIWKDKSNGQDYQTNMYEGVGRIEKIAEEIAENTNPANGGNGNNNKSLSTYYVYDTKGYEVGTVSSYSLSEANVVARNKFGAGYSVFENKQQSPSAVNKPSNGNLNIAKGIDTALDASKSVLNTLRESFATFTLPQTIADFIKNKYAEGGLVDYTGLAWVDGTTSQPESFLDATDTKLLRGLLDTFDYITVQPFHVPDVSSMSNSSVVGDVNITINQAELKEDADYDKVARKIGQAFTRELGKQGLNLAGYSFT